MGTLYPVPWPTLLPLTASLQLLFEVPEGSTCFRNPRFFKAVNKPMAHTNNVTTKTTPSILGRFRGGKTFLNSFWGVFSNLLSVVRKRKVSTESPRRKCEACRVSDFLFFLNFSHITRIQGTSISRHPLHPFRPHTSGTLTRVPTYVAQRMTFIHVEHVASIGQAILENIVYDNPWISSIPGWISISLFVQFEFRVDDWGCCIPDSNLLAVWVHLATQPPRLAILEEHWKRTDL